MKFQKESIKNKKIVAWGASPLFSLYLQHCSDHKVAYCIDLAKDKQGKAIEDVQIVGPDVLDSESKDDLFIINFGHSSGAIQSINQTLSDRGMVLGCDYLDFAEFAKTDFKNKAQAILDNNFSNDNFVYARAFNFNSTIPLQTTVLGNWLLLEALSKTIELDGAIAEIGAYKAGNSFLLASAMSLLKDLRKYYIIDSFEGFSKMSKSDPAHLQEAYNYDYNFSRIENLLSVFERVQVIKDFVPKAFEKLDDNQKYSVVFFDCDLYQPALDTYNYFWDKLQPGGMLVIHDNVATLDGWTGVRKATEEFFSPRKIVAHDLWETTMSVVLK